MTSASLPPQHGNLHPRRRRRYGLVSLTLALAMMLLFLAMSSTPAKASSLDPAAAAANGAPFQLQQQMRKRSASGATKKQARVVKALGTLGSFTDALPTARTFVPSDKGSQEWAQQLQGLNGELPVVTERQAPSQGAGRMQKRSQVGMARLNEQMERDEGVDYLIARKQARSAKPFMGSKGRAEQKAPAARQQRLREEQDNVEGDEEDVYDEDEDSIDEQGRDADEEAGRYSVDPATHPLP